MPVRDATRSCRRSDEPVRVERPGMVDYVAAWEHQRDCAAARRECGGPDVLLLLEHPSVYTAGKRTPPADRPTDGTPVVDVDRGGLITWHGPGQLVGYPIVALAEPVRRRRLRASPRGGPDRRRRRAGRAGARPCCGPHGGVVAGRRPGTRSGRSPRSASAYRAGVTLHGFALNCAPDLSAFGRIVPCGITDAGVTSLSVEPGGRSVSRMSSTRRRTRCSPRWTGCCRSPSTRCRAPRRRPAWTCGCTPHCGRA